MFDSKPLELAERTRVRQQIAAAFRDVPMPAEEEIIAQPSTGDIAGESRIRQELLGKCWNHLSPEFLKEWWSSFCYLGPQAFQYYLPALLISSLDNPDNGCSFYHSILFELNPSANAIYYEGTDERFDLQTSLFTVDQLRAVAAYLGLFMNDDDPYSLIFLSGRAFCWGWDKVETPERRAFGDFYHRMHHFRYPNPADPSIAGLVNKIRAAFADTPYPGDNNLSGSEQGDEPAECALEFRGLDWRTLHPHLLANNYTSLSFLTAEGFRYFLPAYLIANLMEIESNADPVFHLTHGLSTPKHLSTPKRLSLLDQVDFSVVRDLYPHIDTEEELREMLRKRDEEQSQTDWSSYAIARMSLFDRREREAIIYYLEHRVKNDDYSRPQIEEALDRYWRPSLIGLAPG